MNIQQRILLGPLVAVLLLAVFGAVAYRAVSAQGAAMAEIKETRFEHFKVSAALAERIARAHVDLFGLVTWFTAYDKPTQERLVAEAPKTLAAIGADLKRWQADPRLNSEEKQRLASIAGLVEKYRKDADAAIYMVQIDVTSALGDLKNVAASFQALNKAFDDLNELERRLADATYAEATAAARDALRINALVLLMAIVIAATIGLLTARRLLRQLGGEPADAAEIATRIAAGDLAVEVPAAPTGSLLAAMATMRDGLRSMIARMNANAAGLSSAAEQVAGAAQQVATSSSEQNDAASSMAAAIEQMSVSISNVADSANEASGLSTHSGATAREGAGIVMNAAQEMENIAGSVQGVAAAIRELGANAQRISGVVTVIGEVANQTNLLALNAAIEAARAGEQGRGFAVVADEVRKLAERTTHSTKEIGAMIGAIQASANEAVEAMAAAAERTAQGVVLARDAGGAIERIQEEAGRVLAAVGAISDSLREQGSVTQDIANHVERIARMSDDNNSRASESAAASVHLQELAHSLRDEVGRFKI